ncbi:MAG: hypothetical protein ACOY0T_04665 [Myxococcota bacterium]
MELSEALSRVLHEHELLFGAAIDATGAIIARAGDPTLLKYTGLVPSLLGPRGAAKSTFDSLSRVPLPQMFSQSEDFAIVDKPSRNLAILVCGTSDRSAVERAVLAEEVGKTIRKVFASVGRAGTRR